jgi:hypothetical protein
MSFTENRLEYLQQKVRSVLSLFFGEWYLDTSLGIPYIPATDSKIAHRFLIESRVQTKLMAIKGITKLIYFTPEYKSNERILSISFAAETDSGEILEMEEAWNMG